MLAEISSPRGFDARLATVGYIVRGLLDESLPNRHTSQGTANGMAGPVERCSPDNHTCSFVSRPLVERVRGNQAPPTFQGLPERGLHARSFGSCIDHLCRNRRVSSPRWYESPANKRHFPDRFLRILANDRDILGRGYVVSGIPVIFHRGAVEILFNNLFPPR